MEDNYSQWEAKTRREEQWLEKRPVCFYCGEPVQEDHYFDINDEVVCQDCLDAHFRKDIDEYF